MKIRIYYRRVQVSNYCHVIPDKVMIIDISVIANLLQRNKHACTGMFFFIHLYTNQDFIFVSIRQKQCNFWRCVTDPNCGNRHFSASIHALPYRRKIEKNVSVISHCSCMKSVLSRLHYAIVQQSLKLYKDCSRMNCRSSKKTWWKGVSIIINSWRSYFWGIFPHVRVPPCCMTDGLIRHASDCPWRKMTAHCLLRISLVDLGSFVWWHMLKQSVN